MKKALIRFDWAMKRLLRQKANFGILEGFLSVLLNEDIQIEQILESESNQEEASLKFNRVDILALNANKQLVIIELQNNSEVDYFHRILFGTSKAITEHFTLGSEYKAIKKVYSINIVYFNLGHGDDYVYRGITEFKGIHSNDILGLSPTQKNSFILNHVSQIFPEYFIIKVNNFNDLAKDSLDEWIYYLKNNEVKEGSKAQGLELVRQKLEFEELSPQDKASYIKAIENKAIDKDVIHTARIEGRYEGEQIGLEKGLALVAQEKQKAEHDKALDTARKMKADLLPDEVIAKYTGLSLAEIRAL